MQLSAPAFLRHWRLALAGGLLASLAMTGAVAQQRHGYGERFAPVDAVLSGDLIDVSVIDRTYGRGLPVYYWRGKNYIAGNPGSVYQLRLTNTTNRRVMAVVAVDGINVITGRNASPDQVGYVLSPYQSITIDGWRKSQTRVAQFNFTSVRNSYAGRTGRWDQVGVIGVAVFAERMVRPVPYPYPRSEEDYGRDRAANNPPAPPPAAAGAPAQKSAAAERSIGTGHGDSQWSPVGTTTFTRASSTPNEILRIDYDREEVLARRGIIPRTWREDDNEPEAFPGGYVPDPPRRW